MYTIVTPTQTGTAVCNFEINSIDPADFNSVFTLNFMYENTYNAITESEYNENCSQVNGMCSEPIVLNYEIST